MVSKWCSSATMHYMLGGDKHHARELAKWLVSAKEDMGRKEETHIGSDYRFADKEIALKEHHLKGESDSLTVNLRESMEYIT